MILGHLAEFRKEIYLCVVTRKTRYPSKQQPPCLTSILYPSPSSLEHFSGRLLVGEELSPSPGDSLHKIQLCTIQNVKMLMPNSSKPLPSLNTCSLTVTCRQELQLPLRIRGINYTTVSKHFSYYGHCDL